MARPGVLSGALQTVDPTPVTTWRDPLAFLEPMSESVGNAMYWQPPHEEDVLAADPAVVAALRPVAEAIASSPAAGWWSTPLAQQAQRLTCAGDHDHPSAPPVLTGARQRLRSWRLTALEEERRSAAERPADPAAPFSGTWWSTPALVSLVTTTRQLPGLGSVELTWKEDSFDKGEAAIWPLSPTRRPRVWEVDGPRAWTRLVDRYPLDVTHARRHDWYRTTGRAGAWRIPDWDAVADDWDAVHLSVAGYLATATRALPLADDDAATVLAGWSPDQSWWLNDVLTTETAEPERWRSSTDSDSPAAAWHRALTS